MVDLDYYIIFSKSSYLPIREFTVSYCYPCDANVRLYEEEVLDIARKICDELNHSFDDICIYQRCYFKE